MRIVLALGLLAFPICVLRAANVLWNFTSGGGSIVYENGVSIAWSSSSQWSWGWLNVSLDCESSAVGTSRVSFSNCSCDLATEITWTKMMAEDIVDAVAFGEGKTSLFSNVYSDGATGSLTVRVDQPFYLAFQAYELIYTDVIDPATGSSLARGNAHYGWVKLNAESATSVSVLASAMNLGAEGMVVGGGAIPEPTAGLLALLGLSALALRRKSSGHRRV